jgi:DNA-directed RNA polymerase subunit M/transcription elongation factor TFIIS
MEQFEFIKIIKDLCDYYERPKEPRQGTIELWFGKVKSIPSEPINWISKKIEDDYDSFPRNLPGAMWGAFREWQQANPHRMTEKQYFDCPECSKGLIYAKNIKNGHSYGYVFRCAMCRQSTVVAYPMALRTELQADYEVTPKSGNSVPSKFPRVQLKMDGSARRMAPQYYEPLVAKGKAVLLDVTI